LVWDFPVNYRETTWINFFVNVVESLKATTGSGKKADTNFLNEYLSSGNCLARLRCYETELAISEHSKTNGANGNEANLCS